MLSRFSDNLAGQVCKTDDAIVFFGSKFYDKICRKTDKRTEVKKSVMSDMRRIAILYLKFREKCSAEEAVMVQSTD